MYEIAEELDPESIRAASEHAFRDLYRRGVRTVGEFHYVHHGPGGVPYAEPHAMRDALRLLVHRCQAGHTLECPIIEALDD